MRRLVPIVLLTVLAGCGTERAEPLQLDFTQDLPKRSVSYKRVGMKLAVPDGAPLQARERPGVFRLFLGEPVVAAFAYRRREQIPKNKRALRDARKRLEKEIRGRDKDFERRGSEITKVAGAPAIEVVGDQTLSGGHLRTRSVHIYKGKAEYVLELLAPVREYRQIDAAVFAPLLKSLEVSGKIKEPRKKKRDKKEKRESRKRDAGAP